MKIKNKTRFRVLCTLYVIGYLFFCIFGGMNSGMMISDSPALEFAAIYYGLPVGVRNLSVSMFVWIILSFFLVLAILWQTDLSKQKLNRTALLCLGGNMLLTCLSRGIVEWLVSGVAEGCKQSNAALIGGETAEMPGFYPVDEYDLAGFAVGVVDRKDMITGKTIAKGDVLVGIASSGIHSNGFSLVRKVFDIEKTNLNKTFESLGGKTLGETLLAPTIIYVKALRSVKEGGITIKGCSHITGGGFYENIPRMLHDGVHAQIKADSYEIPPIFDMLAKDGDIAKEMMYNTYNMGVGMILAVDAKDADKTVELVNASGQKGFIIGEITEGEKGITLV